MVTIRFFLYMGQEVDDTTNAKNQVLRHLEDHNNIVTPPANMGRMIAVIWTRKTCHQVDALFNINEKTKAKALIATQI